MHIAEGVAPLPVALGGAVIAAAGVAFGLRRTRDEDVPRTALVAAAMFAASILIRLPLGPSYIHPTLNGLAGLMLGWAAIPALAVSLLLQTIIFHYGGYTTLGVNIVVMGLPAVACHLLFRKALSRTAPQRLFLLGAFAGVSVLLLSFVLWSLALILCGEQFRAFVVVSLPPHLAICAVEGIFTGFVVAFLHKVYPHAFARRSAS